MKGNVFFLERCFKLTFSLFSYSVLLFVQYSFLVLWIISTSRPSLLCLSAAGWYVHSLPVDDMLLEQVFSFLLFVSFLLAQEFSFAEYEWWNCCALVLERNECCTDTAWYYFWEICITREAFSFWKTIWLLGWYITYICSVVIIVISQ